MNSIDALKAAIALVDTQAEDDGLWFRAETAPEAYLQQELRKLHASVEAARDISYRISCAERIAALQAENERLQKQVADYRNAMSFTDTGPLIERAEKAEAERDALLADANHWMKAALTADSRIGELEAERDALRQALTDIFAMVDEGLLVRDTSHDADDDYAYRVRTFSQRLSANYAALNERGDGDG